MATWVALAASGLGFTLNEHSTSYSGTLAVVGSTVTAAGYDPDITPAGAVAWALELDQAVKVRVTATSFSTSTYSPGSPSFAKATVRGDGELMLEQDSTTSLAPGTATTTSLTDAIEYTSVWIEGTIAQDFELLIEVDTDSLAATIVFNQIEGGETETELPLSSGSGTLALSGFGYGESIAELGAAGLGVLLLAQANSGSGVEDPSFGVGFGTLDLLAGYSYSAGTEAPATGSGVLPLIGTGYEAEDVGYGILELIGFGQSIIAGEVAPPPLLQDTMVQVSDSLLFGDGFQALQTLLIRTRLELGAQPRTSWEGTAALRDVLALEDGLLLVFRELMQVSLALGDSTTVTTTAIVQMVDALLLGGAVETELEAVTLIVEALTFGALATSSQVATLQSSLSLGDSIAQTYQAMVALVDGLLVGENLTAQVTMVAAISDALSVGADGTYSYEAHAVLRDGLAFVLRLAIDNEDYVAWAINTESKALSRYTQYPFNSFMKVGDKYYGATDTGLHLLEGADDAGAPIEAKLRLGMSSMGTRVLKRSPAMYAGYTASGDLLLKVVTASAITAEREAHAYRLIARAATSVREGRVPIGRGLRSVYFDYQLENIDGSDFELDVIEFQPLTLERRVRGNSGGKR